MEQLTVFSFLMMISNFPEWYQWERCSLQ